MKRIRSLVRAERLIRGAIQAFDLDLDGIDVLTEAASGNFAVTPLIAAMSNAASVTAVTRDSRFGSAVEVKDYVASLAAHFGVTSTIEITTDSPASRASTSQLITNLGFVRPIDRKMIEALPSDAAIALMWEPWEFRRSDLDLEAARTRGVPILGTRESDPRLGTFGFVGMLIIKLLLELELEVRQGRFLMVGTQPFADAIRASLEANGAEVSVVLVDERWHETWPTLHETLANYDALILADHSGSGRCLVGGADGLPLSWIEECSAVLVHLCGCVDEREIIESGVCKHPAMDAKPGSMTVTTDYLGLRPVVGLHTAGLKVGELLVRGMRSSGDPSAASRLAMASGLALAIEDQA